MSVTLNLNDIRALLSMAEQYTADDPDGSEYEFAVAFKREGELHDSDDGTPSPAGVYMADVEAISEGWIKVDVDAVKARPTDVTRLEDMSPRGHMNIVLDADGDVCISVKSGDDNGRITEWAHVEFCTGLGGGGSPRTYRALLDLMQAMDDDNHDPNRQHRAMT